MIHGGAEDSTDIENSNSDAERRTPTPSSTRRDDASADRGSSPDKARGSDATTAAVGAPRLRPARHSIDRIVARLDPHAPRALEPDRTIDETTTRGDMSAAVANGNGTHKVQVQVQDGSEDSSDSDDDKLIVAPKETAAKSTDWRGVTTSRVLGALETTARVEPRRPVPRSNHAAAAGGGVGVGEEAGSREGRRPRGEPEASASRPRSPRTRPPLTRPGTRPPPDATDA